ncbi:polyphosphate kinase 1 [Ktedonosporobacter rubrisoli]|uniref:Polyphosphate kinase n=1 Tax=Ktedonosporobacter rubrisoli TaxID=2509675 RepID=A0A4P6JX13_KTERU|nr:polyphosphate kinase 1 [Ktedonosporobacter rubrisoli]QBD80277.1 polyphosphate kinase 1 [Ktedonosporobacter rubrisoli]
MIQKSLVSTTDLERPENLYINRELSWIEFNRRVFEQAKDKRHPLLERVKFISIFETNLDEFIMIRLAGLKDRVASGVPTRSPDGRTAEQQIAAVRERLAPLVQEVRQYWRNELLPLLAEQHIYILDYEQLDEQQHQAMHSYFVNEIFPVLTPLAVDPFHPFPHISNRSLNLAVVLSDQIHGDHFARVKVPPALPRLVPVPIAPQENEVVAFVWIEQVIAANISMLFPGFEVWESYPFRVLRDADIELQEDEASDLLEYIEQEVRERRFGQVVDLMVNPSMPPRIRSLLLDNLEISPRDLTVIDGPMGMGDVIELYNLDRPELKNHPFTSRTPAFLQKGSDLFSSIQRHDLLVHHPYDSFNSVVDFICAAARDPQVLAIKQTLYRVGQNSPVVKALLEAVENGKQVAVVVELKARFDEENNIVWARELERAGVHVVYGLIGLKTHAKIALVVRREREGLRRYVHLSTGNYNASTARIYEDLGLFTCQPAIGADATALFNSLTGYSRQNTYRKLLVAPVGLRRGIVERIEREIRIQQEFGNGRLIFKINALIDPEIVQLLYRAAQAGVEIDLIVRGMCSLRPGIPSVSENIRVRSLVGRFLEHSRIYYFGNNGSEEIFLGSADMMQRNLNARVEILFPLEAPALRQAVLKHVLEPIMADTVNTHELQSDGTYKRLELPQGEIAFDSQAWFISHPLFEADEGLEKADTTISAIPSSA